VTCGQFFFADLMHPCLSFADALRLILLWPKGAG